MSGADLSNANLGTCNLTGANLKDAQLEGAIFSSARLDKVGTIENSDWTDVILRKVERPPPLLPIPSISLPCLPAPLTSG